MVQRKQTFPQHQPVRTITHREIAEVRSWLGWQRSNRPARKDIVRNFAEPHREIHPAKGSQEAERKFSRERLSLRIRINGCSHYTRAKLPRQVEFACGIRAFQIRRVAPRRGEDVLLLLTAADGNDAGHGSISF